MNNLVNISAYYESYEYEVMTRSWRTMFLS